MFFLWWRRHGEGFHWAVFMLALKEQARGDINEGGELSILDKMTDAFYGGEKHTTDDAQESDDESYCSNHAGGAEESRLQEISAALEDDDAAGVAEESRA